jgi:hypothetical protein
MATERLGKPFDPIEGDFEVDKVWEGETLSMYAAPKGGLLHFVFVTRIQSNGLDNLHDFSVYQAHIPRYVLAAAAERLLEFGSFLDAGDVPENTVHTAGPFWQDWSLGCTRDLTLMLLKESWQAGACPLGAIEAVVRDDIAALREARQSVNSQGEDYSLPGRRTHGGNPVVARSKALIEAIAFEEHLHGALDPVNLFEVFSAYCTLADSPLCSTLQQSYCDQVLSEQGSVPFEDVEEDIGEFLDSLQRDLFGGAAVWGPDALPEQEARAVSRRTIEALDNVQRCQFVLMRDLHRTLLILGLGVALGKVSWATYFQLMTRHVSPDSDREQSIRSQGAFIELLGFLC